MVGGRNAARRPVGQALVVGHGPRRFGRAQVQDPAARGRRGGRPRQGAAQDRQDIGGGRRCADLRRTPGAPGAFGDESLDLGHQGDHPFVALAGGGAEAEHPVLQQHQPLGVGPPVPRVSGGAGEVEARHDIGHADHPIPEDLLEQALGVRLIGQGEHGGGMGVVDELVGDEGVQQGLDGGVGRAGVQEALALGADHVLVAEPVQGAQAHEGGEAHRRVARRLDRAEVPARALDAQDLDLVAEQVPLAGLHRGVAAAMQHQARITAEQAGAVGAKGEVFADALPGVAIHSRLGVLFVPQTFHVRPPVPRRRKATSGRARKRDRRRAR